MVTQLQPLLYLFSPASYPCACFQHLSQAPVLSQPHFHVPVFFPSLIPVSRFPFSLIPMSLFSCSLISMSLFFLQPHFHVPVYFQPHFCVAIFSQPHSCIVNVFIPCHSHVPIPMFPLPCPHSHVPIPMSPLSGPFLCQPYIGPPHSRIVPIFSQPGSHDVPALHLFPCCVYFQ